MFINDLINKAGIDPREVLIVRHRPSEPSLRKILPHLAEQRHDLYNAYQQSHGPKLEKALKGANYLLSFIGHQPRRALFVGLYKVASFQPISFHEFWRMPAHSELRAMGMIGYTDEEEGASSLHFELVRQDFYEEWQGKLVVVWPGLERSWWRWADRNHMPVAAIHQESVLSPSTLNWREEVLSWHQLAVLPTSWQSIISKTRGVYLIHDQGDGKSYVGSAYGAQNILGRWLNYAASGHGGNMHLKGRDPGNFQFSILERVSPDMGADEVIQLENSWKQRLHTRYPTGLNDN